MDALVGQGLWLAQEVGVGHIRLDGSKIQADASQRQAVSDNRLLDIENRWRAEVHAVLNLGESANHGAVVWPGGVVKSPDGSVGWKTGRGPKRSWKRGPRNARRRNKPTTKPNAESARKKPNTTSGGPGENHPNRHSRVPAIRTSTISPTQLRAA